MSSSTPVNNVEDCSHLTVDFIYVHLVIVRSPQTFLNSIGNVKRISEHA